MKSYPSVPPLAAVPEILDGGHLWIQEHVDGGLLRFRLDESGRLEIAGDDGVFDYDDVPLHYDRAVDYLRSTIDTAMLERGVSDPSSIVYFGVATYRRRIDYDWERLPPVCGHDVWSGPDESFLSPDVVMKVFERIGLESVPAVEKERRAVDFDPTSYELPASRFRDGPVAGVVVRNKAGGRGVIRAKGIDWDADAIVRDAAGIGRGGDGIDWGADGSDIDGNEVDAIAAGGSAPDLVEAKLTRGRLDRLADELTSDGWPVTAETLFDRALSAFAREVGPDPLDALDPGDLRAAIADRTSRYLADGPVDR